MNNNATQLLTGDFNPLQKYKTYLTEETTKSERTINNYLLDLGVFEKFLFDTKGSLHNLTRTDVQNYINHLNELERKPATIRRHFNSIKGYAKYADKLNTVDSIRDIPKEQKKTNISEDTLERKELLAIFRTLEIMDDIRNEAIIKVLAYTGIRISELMNLNIGHIELKRDGRLFVLGKGGKTREVPFPVEARRVVEMYLETREDKDNKKAPLFVSNRGSRMDRSSLFRVVQKVDKLHNATKKESEKIHLHPHIFRHSYARILIKDNGIDIVTAAQILGHESIEITRRYAMDSLSEISSKLDKLTF